MSELSRQDVISVLGPLSDAAVAEIIATGATTEVLAAARERIIRQHKTHNPGPPMEPGALASVIEILERSPHGLFGESGSTLR